MRLGTVTIWAQALPVLRVAPRDPAARRESAPRGSSSSLAPSCQHRRGYKRQSSRLRRALQAKRTHTQRGSSATDRARRTRSCAGKHTVSLPPQARTHTPRRPIEALPARARARRKMATHAWRCAVLAVALVAFSAGGAHAGEAPLQSFEPTVPSRTRASRHGLSRWCRTCLQLQAARSSNNWSGRSGVGGIQLLLPAREPEPRIQP